MISVNKLSIQYTGEYLFNDVSFIINDRDRIGLVGKNGAGKSTLLKILSGKIDPEKGEIVKTSGQTLGYLPQEMIIECSKTVFEEALNAFEEAKYLKNKIQTITEEISNITDYESETYTKLLSKFTEFSERFDIIGGNTMNAETEKVLIGLGFEKNDFDKPLSHFSGGWQMRVELAKVLLKKPDTLLLDEPTNHLDIESIQWLENFLKNYQGAIVLVSHDRAFLDNITNRTIEISLAIIFDYKVSYSEYVIQRQERQQQQISAFNNQQKEIQSVERFIEKFRYKASKARQVQSKIKLLDKIDIIEIEEIDKSSIFFKFPDAPHSGKIVLEAKNIKKNYGSNLVLNDLSFVINKGERIAFVGKNGEGKTTLSKIIVGEAEFDGILNLGYQVKIGYYAQNQAAMLDPEKTVFQTIDDIAVGEIRTKIRMILGGFLFGGEQIDKKVKVLSGGEKSRLALAKLLLTPVNFLVLDEPTNHLDMQSKDILKNALLQYKGTLIVVSHDRDFLQGLTEKVFEFKCKNIRTYIGDIYDFLEYKNIETLKQLENTEERKNSNNKSEQNSENKINWEKKKNNEKELRKIKNKIQKCEEEISKLEIEIKEMDKKMANLEQFENEIKNANFFIKYDMLKQEINILMHSWENLHNELIENED